MIDSGASRTLLRSDMFNDIAMKTHRPLLIRRAPCALQSVTGHTLPVKGLAQIKVDGAGIIEVYIVDKLAHEMILGVDSLHRGKAILNLDLGLCYNGPCYIPQCLA